MLRMKWIGKITPLTAMLAILALPVAGVCGQQPEVSGRPATKPLSQPMSYEEWLEGNRAKPFTMAWGGFTVKVQEDRRDQELSIIGHGRIRQRLIAHGLDVDTIPWQNGKTALRITAHNGANSDSGHWTYLFAADTSDIRNVLKFHGDLDSVGKAPTGAQIVATSTSDVPLELFIDFCTHCCGNIAEVVAWRHGKPYLANRQYTAIARDAAADQWDQMMEESRRSDDTHPEKVARAMGYYANEWTIGQGPAARRRLKRTLGAADWRWFLRCQPELRRRLRTMVSEITTDRRRVIRIPDAFLDDD